MFGHLPDPVDSRDWNFEESLAVGAGDDIPENFSLAEHYVKTDQWRTSRCVGFSAAQCIHVARAARGIVQPFPSAGFIYTGARLQHQDAKSLEDTGTWNRAAAWAVAHHGCSAESKWPSSDLSLMNREPDISALHDALPTKHRLEYRRVFEGPDDVELIVRSIAAKCPVQIAIPVDEALTQSSGPEDIEGISSPVKGFHAVCALGYKTVGSKRYIQIGNSWGSWRKDGLAYLSGAFVHERSTDKWSFKVW